MTFNIHMALDEYAYVTRLVHDALLDVQVYAAECSSVKNMTIEHQVALVKYEALCEFESEIRCRIIDAFPGGPS